MIFEKLFKSFRNKENDEQNSEDYMDDFKSKKANSFNYSYDFEFFTNPNYIVPNDENLNYPISRCKAYHIANLNENLKTDYYRQCKKNITYMNFSSCSVNLIKYENEPYWEVQIEKGDVSWIEYPSDGYTTFCDGFFIDEDLKKLRCLVNAYTGKYIYYPC